MNQWRRFAGEFLIVSLDESLKNTVILYFKFYPTVKKILHRIRPWSNTLFEICINHLTVFLSQYQIETL